MEAEDAKAEGLPVLTRLSNICSRPSRHNGQPATDLLKKIELLDVGTGNFKGGINDLHQRFREKEVAIFQKHGAEIVGVWQQMNSPDTLVWMLAYRDRAHRDEVWAKFNADPEWAALRSKYPVPVNANTFMMSASDYSPMK